MGVFQILKHRNPFFFHKIRIETDQTGSSPYLLEAGAAGGPDHIPSVLSTNYPSPTRPYHKDFCIRGLQLMPLWFAWLVRHLVKLSGEIAMLRPNVTHLLISTSSEISWTSHFCPIGIEQLDPDPESRVDGAPWWRSWALRLYEDGIAS